LSTLPNTVVRALPPVEGVLAKRAVLKPRRTRLEVAIDPTDTTALENLTNEQLARAYQDHGWMQCLEVLLCRNERICHYVLKRFARSEEPYEDLFQVARMGLLKAAQRFDGTRGTAFSTYAFPLVEGEVRHYLRDNMLVRQPRWAKSLYDRIQQVQGDFLRDQGRSPTMSELADAVNVQEEGILELIRFYGSIDVHSLEDNGAEVPNGLDRGAIKALRPENFNLPIEDRILLYDALGALSEAHKKLLYLLFFKGLTQQEAADELGMSQRTVSREQTRALDRLKAILTKKIF